MTRSVARSSKQIPATADASTLPDLVLVNEIVAKDPPQLADRLRSFTDHHSSSLLPHGAAMGIALLKRYSRLRDHWMNFH